MSTPSSSQLTFRIQEASQLIRNGRRAEATMLYESLAREADDDFAVNLQLGHLCTDLAAVKQAIDHYQTAQKQKPDDAHCLMHLASAYEMGGQSDIALRYFKESLQINDQLADAHRGLGAILLRLGRFPEAHEHLRRAHSLKPSDPYALMSLALTLMHLDEHEAARVHAEKAMKISGTKPDAKFVLVRILTESGRIEEAVKHCEQIIRKHKTFGAAYDFYARLRKFSSADKPFIGRTEKVLNRSMGADDRRFIHYALGKIYDDCQEWDKAIEHYHQANLLQKRDFDIKQESRYFKTMTKTVNASVVDKFRGSGHSSDQPVFIVGMPRSGTTLMEQMIASHPDAATAGELPDMPRIAKEFVPDKNAREENATSRVDLNKENIHAKATEYLDALCNGREHAARVVDKLPGNFLYLGLIAILFPNATILHAVRHPLDTCLSCYFQNFSNILWANELKTIAYAYRKYREIMTHWQRVLPDGMITDVSYERLIEKPDSEGRLMLEACGLEWDPEILEFHRKDRAVKTASVWQVRQPIYQSSSERWRNYAPHIAELAEALSECLQPELETLEAAGIRIRKSSGQGWFRRLAG